MHSIEILKVYVVVVAGVVVWLAGLRFVTEDPRDVSSVLGRFLSFVGVVLFALGMYAGFRGPLKIAGITLECFPFSSAGVHKSSQEALSYVKRNLSVTRRPAAGWRGPRANALEYVVRNNGNKTILNMNARYSTTSGPPVVRRLNGPFRPGKTVTVIVRVPSNVGRSYFAHGRNAAGEIIGARF